MKQNKQAKAFLERPNIDELLRGLEPDEVYQATFTHIYNTCGFDPGAKKYHTCLEHGYWCWSNALSDPLMAIRFLVHKIRNEKT